jgi:hypothetical protein
MSYTWTAGDSYNNTVSFPVEMRATPTLTSGATFTASSGNNGTPAFEVGNNKKVIIYNVSGNWSLTVRIAFNGVLTAEL